MKKHIYIFLLVVFTFSCNNNDDHCSSHSDPTLYGTWSLINVSGGFAGVNQDFEAGIITWTFDNQSQELTIINTNTEAVFDGYPSGVYDFQVLTPEDGFITIVLDDSVELDIDTLTNHQLILDEGIAFDGFSYTFVK
ncbi:hypothetical protein [Psychroserpens mesophilus]|uniref:hypothetical protein n=1 Tax=Psychroserpens mesophilus TaxID=325473 RepID=UPI003D64DD89